MPGAIGIVPTTFQPVGSLIITALRTPAGAPGAVIVTVIVPPSSPSGCQVDSSAVSVAPGGSAPATCGTTAERTSVAT